MYLPNKYTRWYYQIIENANTRPKFDGYTEKHHIIPKSLGGSNLKENLVRLTAREHFLCHWLLTKMLKDPELIKMKRALWRMLVKGSDFQKRYLPNSRIYASLRSQYGSLRKGAATSNEAKLKISLANTGKTPWNKGVARSLEEKNKISISRLGSVPWNKGISRTSEEKHKLSIAAKNRTKIQCQHCDIIVTPSNYKRWHGDNCKVMLGV